MSEFFKQKNKAFTLVETLVAISIFTVSLLGIMSVLASGISNTNYAKQKMTATYLAQEGIEYTRNMRDNYMLYNLSNCLQTGWDAFKCSVPTTPSTFYSTTSDFASFTRLVWMDQVSADEVKIFSKVEWTQGSGPHDVTFSENLFNWIE